jgi:selenocysteine lyase/cysteine desulfurase
MESIYLNDTDGRKLKKLTDKNINDSIDTLTSTLKQRSTSLWSDNINDIYIDQNISTHIAYVIDLVSKKHKDVSVYVDSHEVFWIRDNVQNGKLSLDDMSYPNYAPRHQYISESHNVTIFDPEKELEISHDGSMPIVIYTHASRLTGQIFPLESIFKKIKERHPNAVCIADGAQMIGGKKIYTLEYTDAYIVPTSKFIGAEFHIGLCLLSNQFKTLYISDDVTYPSVDISMYKKELHSTNESLSSFVGVDFESHIQVMREYLIESFLKARLSEYIYVVKDQAPHIVTLSVGDRTITESFVKSLEKEHNISVSHNMNFSLVEPRVPLVRVSISVRCTKEYIDTLVSACEVLLK